MVEIHNIIYMKNQINNVNHQQPVLVHQDMKVVKLLIFLCDGVLIGSQDNKCFVWLKNNASKFGLKNYAAEPWHWSTDGG